MLSPQVRINEMENAMLDAMDEKDLHVSVYERVAYKYIPLSPRPSDEGTTYKVLRTFT